MQLVGCSDGWQAIAYWALGCSGWLLDGYLLVQVKRAQPQVSMIFWSLDMACVS